MTPGDLDARLREIVVRHTVVGGYPDTMAIARDAYAMGLVAGGGDRSGTAADAGTSGISIERTLWQGSQKDDQAQDMGAWIAVADHVDLERLLSDGIDMHDEGDQDFLRTVWEDCAVTAGGRTRDAVRAEVDRADLVTCHWREADRIALRRVVAAIRPEHLQPDPNQGMLL